MRSNRSLFSFVPYVLGVVSKTHSKSYGCVQGWGINSHLDWGHWNFAWQQAWIRVSWRTGDIDPIALYLDWLQFFPPRALPPKQIHSSVSREGRRICLRQASNRAYNTSPWEHLIFRNLKSRLTRAVWEAWGCVWWFSEAVREGNTQEGQVTPQDPRREAVTVHSSVLCSPWMLWVLTVNRSLA